MTIENGKDRELHWGIFINCEGAIVLHEKETAVLKIMKDGTPVLCDIPKNYMGLKTVCYTFDKHILEVTTEKMDKKEKG